MTYLSVDFETRSRVDLRKSGVYPYAADPSTDVWCMAWAVGDGDVAVWTPGRPVPEQVRDWIQEGNPLRAHNAQFERIIWREIMGPRYGFPVPALGQWHCTAAEAAAMGLPRSLDQLSRTLKVPFPKDQDGHRLMLQMCKPRRPTKTDPREWWDDLDKQMRLFSYCIRDVEAERACAARLRRLDRNERAVYLLDQRVNDRGVRLDRDCIVAAEELVAEATDRANREIQQLTGGGAGTVTQVANLTRWLQYSGLDTDNLRKDTVRDLLDEEDGELPPDVRRVLTLRQEVGKSSTAKLRSMQEAMCRDDRARGLLLYHGASTGRWSGRTVQPQNFPRGSVQDVGRYLPHVLDREYDLIDMDHPVPVVVSSMLRLMIQAEPGCRFLSADFSQIEARVLAWIAGQEDLVEAFRTGAKIYERMAARIYGVDPSAVGKDDPRRQLGKMTILGCGFGMGWETFITQAKVQNGIDVEPELGQQAVHAYRTMNDRIQAFWYDIERAAVRAVERPGETVRVGRRGMIKFSKRGPYLWCVLPSGRPLCYSLPLIQPRPTPWGDVKDALTYMSVNSVTRKWERRVSYGGLLTENVVQAIARDLMAAAMLREEAAGYPVVLTVHDEILAEAEDGRGTLEEFLSIMSATPDWAAGLPVAVEGWEGERYKK